MAVACGLDGFVVDCQLTEAGYLTGANGLTPHLRHARHSDLQAA